MRRHENDLLMARLDVPAVYVDSCSDPTALAISRPDLDRLLDAAREEGRRLAVTQSSEEFDRRLATYDAGVKALTKSALDIAPAVAPPVVMMPDLTPEQLEEFKVSWGKHRPVLIADGMPCQMFAVHDANLSATPADLIAQAEAHPPLDMPPAACPTCGPLPASMSRMPNGHAFGCSEGQ